WCDAEDTILLLFVVPPFRICSAWCNVTHILPIYGNVSVASFFYTFLQKFLLGESPKPFIKPCSSREPSILNHPL
ncbi:unnamed protein product, partial [Vitis vinifera]